MSAKTLLIVEDDAIAREGLAVVLRNEGYTVVTAADGDEALDHLATGARFSSVNPEGDLGDSRCPRSRPCGFHCQEDKWTPGGRQGPRGRLGGLMVQRR